MEPSLNTPENASSKSTDESSVSSVIPIQTTGGATTNATDHTTAGEVFSTTSGHTTKTSVTFIATENLSSTTTTTTSTTERPTVPPAFIPPPHQDYIPSNNLYK